MRSYAVPELPEVENIALGLRPVLEGRVLASAWAQTAVILRGPQRHRWRAFLLGLAGQRIVAVTRRAKRLILAFETGTALVVQLGMTGKFLLRDPDQGRLLHTRAVLRLAGPSPEAHFVDVRRFGRIWLLAELDPLDPDPAMRAAGMGVLGPEATTITLPSLRAALRSRRAVKTLLLDQSRIAGLGNIYVDESLFAAGIHPLRPAESLADPEVAVLRRAIRSVLRRAVRAGGTTFSDYRNAYGDMGRFRARLRAYGRAGQACRRCGTPVERAVVGGRGTHWCPRCQTLRGGDLT